MRCPCALVQAAPGEEQLAQQPGGAPGSLSCTAFNDSRRGTILRQVFLLSRAPWPLILGLHHGNDVGLNRFLFRSLEHKEPDCGARLCGRHLQSSSERGPRWARFGPGTWLSACPGVSRNTVLCGCPGISSPTAPVRGGAPLAEPPRALGRSFSSCQL